MTKCPSCQSTSMPAWRKLFLGPAWPTRCRNCGSTLRPAFYKLHPTLKLLLLVSALGAILSAVLLHDPILKASVLSLAIFIAAFVQMAQVPLEAK